MVQIFTLSVTEDGVFGVNTREASQFARGQLLLGGNFRGLAVLGADSECPLILTTYTNNDVSFLYVIGKMFVIFIFRVISFTSINSSGANYIKIAELLHLFFLLDISGDVHCQKMPLSTIPSDMLPFSLITSIAVDDNTNVSIWHLCIKMFSVIF